MAGHPFGHRRAVLGTISPHSPYSAIRFSRSSAQIKILRRQGKMVNNWASWSGGVRPLNMPTDYQDRLRIPLEGNDYTRFETSTGLHVATGYTRIVIGERGPYIEFLPGHLIWHSLHIPDEEKYRLEHPWKDKVFYVEWRSKDQSNVKVYDQKRRVEYADYKVGLFYISPFDLFFEGEAVITKLEKREFSSPSK
jgi:hypothetical protein